MWLAFLLSVSARAENPTTIAIGCAPWDGRSIDVVVSAPDRTYRVSVWGEGLDALKRGAKDVALDNEELSPDTPRPTGRAQVRPTNLQGPARWTEVEGATIHFDTLDLRFRGAASGWIGVGDVHVPFAGTFGPPAECG